MKFLHSYKFYILLPVLSLIFLTFFNHDPDYKSFTPISYQGRFRPISVYQKLWMENIGDFQDKDLFWQIQLSNTKDWENKPIFKVKYQNLKEILNLNQKKSHFSLIDLENSLIHNRESNLNFLSLLIWKSYQPGRPKQELLNLSPGLWVIKEKQSLVIAATPSNPPWHFLKKGMVIEKKLISSKVIDEGEKLFGLVLNFSRDVIPQSNEPVSKRVNDFGDSLRMIPTKFGEGNWASLKSFNMLVHDPARNKSIPVGNFSLYTENQFERIRQTFLVAEKTLHPNRLLRELSTAYKSIEKKPYKHANGKTLFYPSILKLKMEDWYYDVPLVNLCLFIYGLSVIGLIFKKFWGKGFLVTGYLFHTLMLVMRCFILSRPPVSNMYETVLYVPWIAVTVSFFFKNHYLYLASSIVSFTLFLILKMTNLDSNMEIVQAVLDSQYWLTIHVLMVVGSYGLFAISAILGHIYFISKKSILPPLIFKTMYIGLGLLIPGTILGGVWAAESWGRFWDWDPKEAWAFISICVYLIWIHSYKYQKIQNFGLAFGSIIGFLAISFTWYGVNYILGTGLHSYGFGQGGEKNYYFFILFEILFLGYFLSKKSKYIEIKN